MLWSVRTTLADRPGSLAALTRRCGEERVNILGLQIFPEVGGVTDELVLRAPEEWTAVEIAALVEEAGGTAVTTGPCSEHALADPVTRYLRAVPVVAAAPESLSEALAGLLDCTPAGSGQPVPVRHHLDVELVGQRVELRRSTPFTATEYARAEAFAEALGAAARRSAPADGPTADDSGGATEAASAPSLVDPPVTPSLVIRVGIAADAAALVQMHDRCSTDSLYRHYSAPMTRADLRLARRQLVGDGGAVVALEGDLVVGFASLGAVSSEGRCELSILVEDGRQRRGIGTRLLAAAARRAADAGAVDVVISAPAESQAAVAMVYGAGMLARARLRGDQLEVTASTRGLVPAQGRRHRAERPRLPEQPERPGVGWAASDGALASRRYDGGPPTYAP